MKKSLLFLAAFFALGCFMPSAIVTAQTNAAPCKPPAHRTTATHHQQPAPSANQQRQTAPPPAAPSQVDRLTELLAAATTTTMQRDSESFALAQAALKLQADTDAKRIAIEQQKADTEKFVAESAADINDRFATVAELDAAARRKYLPQYARAALLDAKAHMVDATLGNAIRAGGEIGAAILMQPTQVIASGGAGGTATASQSQVQQQTASPSQSQSQVAP
jgi:hypothetical protein